MKISKDAQAIVYKKNADSVQFLLLKRYDKDKNETHYRLIKGGVKEPERTEDAVLREVTEESGLHKLSLKEKIDTYSYQAAEVRHDVDVFVVENIEDEKIAVDSAEEGGFDIEAAEWFNPEVAVEKLNFDQEKKSIKKALEIID